MIGWFSFCDSTWLDGHFHTPPLPKSVVHHRIAADDCVPPPQMLVIHNLIANHHCRITADEMCSTTAHQPPPDNHKQLCSSPGSAAADNCIPPPHHNLIEVCYDVRLLYCSLLYITSCSMLYEMLKVLRSLSVTQVSCLSSLF